MIEKTVITNLRLRRAEWLQIKSAAAELGLSVNEYVRLIIHERGMRRELSVQERAKQRTVWDLALLAKEPHKPEQFSGDDELVYDQQ